eukprot:COSAG06_NODE_19534_length_838_cov_0.884354_1_plen_66_part_00
MIYVPELSHCFLQLSRVFAKLLKLAKRTLTHIGKFRQIPCQLGYWDKTGTLVLSRRTGLPGCCVC